MSGPPLVRRLAERRIRMACRRLPEDMREECYREWVAELSAILADSERQNRQPTDLNKSP